MGVINWERALCAVETHRQQPLWAKQMTHSGLRESRGAGAEGDAEASVRRGQGLGYTELLSKIRPSFLPFSFLKYMLELI